MRFEDAYFGMRMEIKLQWTTLYSKLQAPSNIFETTGEVSEHFGILHDGEVINL
jgi:hypothetical protein